MISGIGVALEGLLRAETKLAKSAERVAGGDISSKAIVDTKIDSLNVKAQAKNLALQAETEKDVLDILA